MHTSRWALVCRLAIVSLLLCAADGAICRAAITSASGRVEASVTQTNATTGQIIDQAFEETPGTTNILPATADATLDIATATDVEGRVSATAAVNVPGETAAEDTNDFAMEAAGLSLLEGRGFTSSAGATQNRQIVFTADELNLESGTRVRVSSDFVISSGLLLVTLPDSANDVVGRIQFAVRQVDDEGSRQVLAGSVEVSFDSAGNLLVNAREGLAGALPVIVNLSDRSSQVDQAQLIVLPLVTLPYEYEAVVDRPFTLRAEVTTTVESAGGAQGGSAFVGRMPLNFTDDLDEFLQVDFSDEVDTAVDLSSLIPTGTPGGTQIEPIYDNLLAGCGAFGLETLLASLALSAAFMRRRFA